MFKLKGYFILFMLILFSCQIVLGGIYYSDAYDGKLVVTCDDDVEEALPWFLSCGDNRLHIFMTCDEIKGASEDGRIQNGDYILLSDWVDEDGDTLINPTKNGWHNMWPVPMVYNAVADYEDDDDPNTYHYSCFDEISANDITLDCGGSIIKGQNVKESNGIKLSGDNVNLINCIFEADSDYAYYDGANIIEIEGNNALISNVTIISDFLLNNNEPDSLITIYNSDNTKIVDSNISGALRGIGIYNSDNVRVENNIISDCPYGGIFSDEGSNGGKFVSNDILNCAGSPYSSSLHFAGLGNKFYYNNNTPSQYCENENCYYSFVVGQEEGSCFNYGEWPNSMKDQCVEVCDDNMDNDLDGLTDLNDDDCNGDFDICYGTPNVDSCRSLTENECGEVDGCLYDYSTCDTVRYSCTTTPTYGEGGCFKENTKVLTPNGEVNIEDIKKGDIVLSYDDKSNKIIERRVLNPLSHEYYKDPAVLLVLENGVEIYTTLNHPFYNFDAVNSDGDYNEYLRLEFFDVGDRTLFFNGSDYEKVKISSIIPQDYYNVEYNLWVESPNNYFANGVLVHNADCVASCDGFGSVQGYLNCVESCLAGDSGSNKDNDNSDNENMDDAPYRDIISDGVNFFSTLIGGPSELVINNNYCKECCTDSFGNDCTYYSNKCENNGETCSSTVGGDCYFDFETETCISTNSCVESCAPLEQCYDEPVSCESIEAMGYCEKIDGCYWQDGPCSDNSDCSTGYFCNSDRICQEQVDDCIKVDSSITYGFGPSIFEGACKSGKFDYGESINSDYHCLPDILLYDLCDEVDDLVGGEVVLSEGFNKFSCETRNGAMSGSDEKPTGHVFLDDISGEAFVVGTGTITNADKEVFGIEGTIACNIYDPDDSEALCEHVSTYGYNDHPDLSIGKSISWETDNGGYCCGDDRDEYFVVPDYHSSVDISKVTLGQCCDTGSGSCSHNNVCYSNEARVDLNDDGDEEVCFDGTWVDCETNSDCWDGFACGDDFTCDCAFNTMQCVDDYSCPYSGSQGRESPYSAVYDSEDLCEGSEYDNYEDQGNSYCSTVSNDGILFRDIDLGNKNLTGNNNGFCCPKGYVARKIADFWGNISIECFQAEGCDTDKLNHSTDCYMEYLECDSLFTHDWFNYSGCFNKTDDGSYKGCLPVDWYGTESRCLNDGEINIDDEVIFKKVDLKLFLTDEPLEGEIVCNYGVCELR